MQGPPGLKSGHFAGRYAVERQIGKGATAIVYLARDVIDGRAVALKVLRPDLGGTRVEDNFLREVRRTSTLDHPHILKVLDAGAEQGRVYFVVPFMEGGTLRARLEREKQLPIVDAVAIARTVAEALDYAHRNNLVHRDVKPENILFTGGEACLGDFGIARAIEAGLGDTTSTSGLARGTVAYMSPEQAGGEEIDGRSDLYSLGCVLYEMLAGVPAFTGPTPEAVFAARFMHPPRELSIYRPTVPPALETLVHRTLAFSPADRFRTAREMVDVLAAVETEPVRHTSGRTPTYSHSERATRSLARRWWRQAAVGAAAAGLAVAAATRWLDRPPGNFRERDWILVADFEGPDDDPGLAHAVRELTTAELNQSRYLSTLPRSQLNATMRLAGIPDTTRVGPQLARELAYRTAVRAVLVGSVHRLGGNNYSVVLHAIDAENGSDILSAAGAAHDTTLITTVESLARRVRAGLGERRSAVAATLPLYQVATPSFAAYRKYTEARRLQTRGDGRASNRLLHEALALDSGFASAWFTMAWNYNNERMLDSARWAFRHAVLRRERLSETDRYRLDADVSYMLEYDVENAIRAYDLYLAIAPRSWAAHNNRGLYLTALGRYEDALESFERAVAAHPFGPSRAQIQVMNQAATLVALRRTPEAERVARDLSGPFAVYIRLLLAAANDRWEEADSVGTSVAAGPSSPAWLQAQAAAVAAAAHASRGAVSSADETLRRAAAAGSPDVARWLYRARLLLAVASERGVPTLPDALARDSTAGGWVARGLAAALRGDSTVARRSLERVRSLPAGDQKRLGSGPQLVEALLEGRSGHWRRAADRIGSAAVRGEHDTAILDRVGSLSLRWLAAEAYARSARTDSAIALLELAIRPDRMPGNEFAQRGLIVTFAHRRLAQWYAASGRPDDAARHWRRFLDGLKAPDADLAPAAENGRAALARLKTT